MSWWSDNLDLDSEYGLGSFNRDEDDLGIDKFLTPPAPRPYQPLNVPQPDEAPSIRYPDALDDQGEIVPPTLKQQYTSPMESLNVYDRLTDASKFQDQDFDRKKEHAKIWTDRLKQFKDKKLKPFYESFSDIMYEDPGNDDKDLEDDNYINYLDRGLSELQTSADNKDGSSDVRKFAADRLTSFDQWTSKNGLREQFIKLRDKAKSHRSTASESQTKAELMQEQLFNIPTAQKLLLDADLKNRKADEIERYREAAKPPPSPKPDLSLDKTNEMLDQMHFEDPDIQQGVLLNAGKIDPRTQLEDRFSLSGMADQSILDRRMSAARKGKDPSGVLNRRNLTQKNRRLFNQGIMFSHPNNTSDGLNPRELSQRDTDLLDLDRMRKAGMTEYNGKPLEEMVESLGGEERIYAAKILETVYQAKNNWQDAQLEYISVAGSEDAEALRDKMLAAEELKNQTLVFAAKNGLDNELFDQAESIGWLAGLAQAAKTGWKLSEQANYSVDFLTNTLDADDQQKLIALNSVIASAPKSTSMQRYQQATAKNPSKNLFHSISRLLFEHPDAASEMFVESMASFLPTAAKIAPIAATAGAGVGALLGRGPGAKYGAKLGAKLSWGIASLGLEVSGNTMQEMRELGINIKDPKIFAAAWANPVVREKITAQALKKGVPIAIMDSFNALAAGKIAASFTKEGRELLTGGQLMNGKAWAKAQNAVPKFTRFQRGSAAGKEFVLGDQATGMFGEFWGQSWEKEPGEAYDTDAIAAEGVVGMGPGMASGILEYVQSRPGKASFVNAPFHYSDVRETGEGTSGKLERAGWVENFETFNTAEGMTGKLIEEGGHQPGDYGSLMTQDMLQRLYVGVGSKVMPNVRLVFTDKRTPQRGGQDMAGALQQDESGNPVIYLNRQQWGESPFGVFMHESGHLARILMFPNDPNRTDGKRQSSRLMDIYDQLPLAEKKDAWYKYRRFQGVGDPNMTPEEQASAENSFSSASLKYRADEWFAFQWAQVVAGGTVNKGVKSELKTFYDTIIKDFAAQWMVDPTTGGLAADSGTTDINTATRSFILDKMGYDLMGIPQKAIEVDDGSGSTRSEPVYVSDDEGLNRFIDDAQKEASASGIPVDDLLKAVDALSGDTQTYDKWKETELSDIAGSDIAGDYIEPPAPVVPGMAPSSAGSVDEIMSEIAKEDPQAIIEGQAEATDILETKDLDEAQGDHFIPPGFVKDKSGKLAGPVDDLSPHVTPKTPESPPYEAGDAFKMPSKETGDGPPLKSLDPPPPPKEADLDDAWEAEQDLDDIQGSGLGKFTDKDRKELAAAAKAKAYKDEADNIEARGEAQSIDTLKAQLKKLPKDDPMRENYRKVIASRQAQEKAQAERMAKAKVDTETKQPSEAEKTLKGLEIPKEKAPKPKKVNQKEREDSFLERIRPNTKVLPLLEKDKKGKRVDKFELVTSRGGLGEVARIPFATKEGAEKAAKAFEKDEVARVKRVTETLARVRDFTRTDKAFQTEAKEAAKRLGKSLKNVDRIELAVEMMQMAGLMEGSPYGVINRSSSLFDDVVTGTSASGKTKSKRKPTDASASDAGVAGISQEAIQKRDQAFTDSYDTAAQEITDRITEINRLMEPEGEVSRSASDVKKLSDEKKLLEGIRETLAPEQATIDWRDIPHPLIGKLDSNNKIQPVTLGEMAVSGKPMPSTLTFAQYASANKKHKSRKDLNNQSNPQAQLSELISGKKKYKVADDPNASVYPPGLSEAFKKFENITSEDMRMYLDAAGAARLSGPRGSAGTSPAGYAVRKGGKPGSLQPQIPKRDSYGFSSEAGTTLASMILYRLNTQKIGKAPQGTRHQTFTPTEEAFLDLAFTQGESLTPRPSRKNQLARMRGEAIVSETLFGHSGRIKELEIQSDAAKTAKEKAKLKKEIRREENRLDKVLAGHPETYDIPAADASSFAAVEGSKPARPDETGYQEPGSAFERFDNEASGAANVNDAESAQRHWLEYQFKDLVTDAVGLITGQIDSFSNLGKLLRADPLNRKPEQAIPSEARRLQMEDIAISRGLTEKGITDQADRLKAAEKTTYDMGEGKIDKAGNFQPKYQTPPTLGKAIKMLQDALKGIEPKRGKVSTKAKPENRAKWEKLKKEQEDATLREIEIGKKTYVITAKNVADALQKDPKGSLKKFKDKLARWQKYHDILNARARMRKSLQEAKPKPKPKKGGKPAKGQKPKVVAQRPKITVSPNPKLLSKLVAAEKKLNSLGGALPKATMGTKLTAKEKQRLTAQRLVVKSLAELRAAYKPIPEGHDLTGERKALFETVDIDAWVRELDDRLRDSEVSASPSKHRKGISLKDASKSQLVKPKKLGDVNDTFSYQNQLYQLTEVEESSPGSWTHKFKKIKAKPEVKTDAKAIDRTVHTVTPQMEKGGLTLADITEKTTNGIQVIKPEFAPTEGSTVAIREATELSLEDRTFTFLGGEWQPPVKWKANLKDAPDGPADQLKQDQRLAEEEWINIQNKKYLGSSSHSNLINIMDVVSFLMNNRDTKVEDFDNPLSSEVKDGTLRQMPGPPGGGNLVRVWGKFIDFAYDKLGLPPTKLKPRESEHVWNLERSSFLGGTLTGNKVMEGSLYEQPTPHPDDMREQMIPLIQAALDAGAIPLHTITGMSPEAESQIIHNTGAWMTGVEDIKDAEFTSKGETKGTRTATKSTPQPEDTDSTSSEEIDADAPGSAYDLDNIQTSSLPGDFGKVGLLRQLADMAKRGGDKEYLKYVAKTKGTLTESIINQAAPIRRLTDMILDSSSLSPTDPARDFINTHSFWHAYFGKGYNEVERAERRFIEPIVQGLRDHGIDLETFGQYLLARAAPSRNKHLLLRHLDRAKELKADKTKKGKQAYAAFVKAEKDHGISFSGITNETAAAVVADLEGDANFLSFLRSDVKPLSKYYAMNKDALASKEESGLIQGEAGLNERVRMEAAASYIDWASTSKDTDFMSKIDTGDSYSYAPMQGFEGETQDLFDHDSAFQALGRGATSTGKGWDQSRRKLVTQGAFGRHAPPGEMGVHAPDPKAVMATTIEQYYNDKITSTKNEVANSFGDLFTFMRHISDPGASHLKDKKAKKLYQAMLDSRPEFKALADSLSAEAKTGISEEFNKIFKKDFQMLDKSERYITEDLYPKDDKGNTLHRLRSTRVTIQKDLSDSPYIFTYRAAGEPMYIEFNHTPEGAAMAATLKNLKYQALPAVLGGFNTATRYLAQTYTSMNPAFIIPNFFRDLGTAAIHLTEDHKSVIAKDIFSPSGMLEVGGFMKAVYSAERRKNKGESILDPDIKIDTQSAKDLLLNGTKEQKYQFALSAGAKVGYFRHDTVAEQITALQKSLKGEARLKQMAKGTLKLVDHMNTAVENSIRMTTFWSAIKNGYSVKQATDIARNVTVDFNQKGNLTQAFGSLYVFFGASMTSMNRLWRTIARRSPAERAALVGGIIGAGMITSLFNRLMDPEGEEDDEPDYDSISSYKRDTNLIVPMPKDFPGNDKRDTGYFSVPVPLGYNMFWTAGQVMGDVLSSQMGLGNTAGILEPVSRIMERSMNTFNPVGGSNFVSAGIPSAWMPIYELLGSNENFMGNPIKYEDSHFSAETPAHTRDPKSTPEHWTNVSRWVNEFMGGSETQKGSIAGVAGSNPLMYSEEHDIKFDMAGNQMKHLFYGYTGGIGKLLDQSFGGLLKASSGDLAFNDYGDVPILGRFVRGTTYGANTRSAYSSIRTAVKVAEASKREAGKLGPDIATRHRIDNRALLSLSKDVKYMDALRKKVRELKAKIEKRKGLSSEQKNTLIDEAEERELKVMIKIVKKARRLNFKA